MTEMHDLCRGAQSYMGGSGPNLPTRLPLHLHAYGSQSTKHGMTCVGASGAVRRAAHQVHPGTYHCASMPNALGGRQAASNSFRQGHPHQNLFLSRRLKATGNLQVSTIIFT